MTQDELIAKMAEIEDRAKAFRAARIGAAVSSGHEQARLYEVAKHERLKCFDVVEHLPPGLLSAMARVAVAKMVGDMTGEAAALSAFRTLLQGAK